MGLFGLLAQWLGVKKHNANIIVLGLDNSGKSTIINKMKPDESRRHEVVPTIGFNVEKFVSRSLSLTAFDMSGQVIKR